MIRRYQPGWLRSDFVAGIVLAAILVPQGMAYAELAGLPAVNGLYATMACLVGYALFGPSRILVLGPDSSLGPLILARDSSPRDRRRPRRVGRSRRDAGAARRRDRDRAGARQARLRRRPALEGGPGRLHDRPGHHDHHGPTPEAVRLLHRCRQVPRRGAGILRRPRRAQPLHVGGRSGLAGPAADPAALYATHPGRAHHRRPLDPRGGAVQPDGQGRDDRRVAAAGTAPASVPVRRSERHRGAVGGGNRHHPRVARRHASRPRRASPPSVATR